MSLSLKSAVFISLIWHIFCFNSLEFTFNHKQIKGDLEFSKIFFLGSILQRIDYRPKSLSRVTSGPQFFRSTIKSSTGKEVMLRPFISQPSSEFKKPHPVNLTDHKIGYFPLLSAPEIKKVDSSIMFYPPMPYHFLLYFKDRQTAHMEVAFYISPKGKVAKIRRKISSGNPEVDLLVMRNLVHFLNLCKSNFALGSWQTVKIDLSP
ncbi:MAG: hypothetical protein ISS44_05365 [Candidatus Omnitrophica bacterium]|nr:hypothetical protein [Candidatus Omnitrophota bacterium]